MEEQNTTNTEETPKPKPRCLNCEAKMPHKATFCPRCGQRNNQGRASMSELFKRFWANFSHLDSRFVKMCWQLLIPAKVTIQYFAGRQKRYPHPVQFFFVVMFFFILLLNKYTQDEDIDLIKAENNNIINIDTTDADAKKTKESGLNNKNLMRSIEYYVLGSDMRNAVDSLPQAWQTPTTRLAVDSVIRRVIGSYEDNTLMDLDSAGNQKRLDSIPITLFDHEVTIALRDVVWLEPEAVLEKYQITNWVEGIMVKQVIKSTKDPNGLLKHYASSLVWTILVLIAVMSLVLYLLYWRRKHYYVEHFVFLMHQNAAAFMILTLLMLFDHTFIKFHPVIWISTTLWISITLLIAMKRFYRQSWGKTTLKWILYCVIYTFSFTFVLVGMILAGLLLF